MVEMLSEAAFEKYCQGKVACPKFGHPVLRT